MEHPHFVEQGDRNATTFALADFSPDLLEKRLNVFPLDICAGRVRENKPECALVLPLHAVMVLQLGTIATETRDRDAQRLNSAAPQSGVGMHELLAAVRWAFCGPRHDHHPIGFVFHVQLKGRCFADIG